MTPTLTVTIAGTQERVTLMADVYDWQCDLFAHRMLQLLTSSHLQCNAMCTDTSVATSVTSEGRS